tara:strand:+ start:1323 stop:1535 length:213 start_codon:yes stop_codon:yes gene_type:complete
MKRSIWVAILFFWVSSLLAQRPNVLLILTDNQSFYELSCHGHPHIRTPRIDGFAAESVDFVNFRSSNTRW